MSFFCDLHTHTTASDGSLTPSQLVNYAAQKGLRAIAVTDHETFAGVEEAAAQGRKLKLEVIPGIELGTQHRSKQVHIVGLHLDTASPALQEMMLWQRQTREARNHEMIEKLIAAGFNISFDDFAHFYAEGTLLARTHIGDLLAQRGYGSNQREVGEKYLDKGRPFFVERELPTPEHCISAIHAAGGLAFVAHPNQISPDRDQAVDICRELLAKGADGIETIYCEFDDDWKQRADSFARETGCVRSGGSDFHGVYKPGLDLGTGYGSLEVPYAILEAQRLVLGNR